MKIAAHIESGIYRSLLDPNLTLETVSIKRKTMGITGGSPLAPIYYRTNPDNWMSLKEYIELLGGKIEYDTQDT